MCIDSSWYSRVEEALEDFCKKVDEKILKEEQQRKASKKKTEFEIKLAHEMKLNCEYKEKLAEYSRRGEELDRICANLSSLSIADRDKQRLENAKEMYQIAKEITGIRFDFSGPPDVAKGYIKNSPRRLLLTFEMDQKQASEGALWDLIGDSGSGKENLPP